MRIHFKPEVRKMLVAAGHSEAEINKMEINATLSNQLLDKQRPEGPQSLKDRWQDDDLVPLGS